VPFPQFTADDRPADILDATGRWIAFELCWRWVKSRHTAEIRDGPLRRQLILQSSTWSRSGIATWVYARVTVLDDELLAWRQARPAATVFPQRQPRPFACNTLLENVDRELGQLECSGLPQPIAALAKTSPRAFVVGFRARVLPVLGLFRAPRLVAEGLPERWLQIVDCGMIEYALARNDRESAATLIRRHMERPLRGAQSWASRINGFRHGWETAPALDLAPRLATAELGWLSRVHHLPGPATFREPRPESPPARLD